MTNIIIKKETLEQEVQGIKEKLINLLNPTNTVYTVLKHVSSSGMTRHISCFVAVTNDRTNQPEIVDITWYVSKILKYKRNSNNGGLIVSGCGMDMGYHIVYSLSCSLFCPKKYDHDQAYKLTQKWL